MNEELIQERMKGYTNISAEANDWPMLSALVFCKVVTVFARSLPEYNLLAQHDTHTGYRGSAVIAETKKYLLTVTEIER